MLLMQNLFLKPTNVTGFNLLRFPIKTQNSIRISLFIILITASLSIKANCNTGTIIVSGKPEYPPISWSQNNKLTGLGYQAIKQILKQLNQQENLNLKLEITKPLPWKRAVHMAELGQIDILVGVRQNPDRAKHLAFISTHLIESAQSIFSVKGSNIIASDDLVGKTGGIRAGIHFSPVFAMFAKKQNLAFEEVQSIEQNIQKLKLKRLDYFIGPLLPTIHHIKKIRSI